MKIIILGLVGVAVVAGGIYWASWNNVAGPAGMASDVMEKTGDTMESGVDHAGDAMMEKVGEVMKKGDAMMDKGVDAMEKTADEVMEKTGETMEKTEETMEKTEETVMMKKVGSFVKLADTDIAKLSGKIVLDFSATWCPSCQTIKKDIEDSLDDIPENTTIVLVDYDTNQDLRVKYGVTGQHTFVQVTSGGEKMKLWRGGITLEDILKEII